MDVSKYLAFPNETPCALYPSATTHSIFGPRLSNTAQVHFQAHYVEQVFFLNAHLQAPMKNGMCPSYTYPEFLSAKKNILKPSNNALARYLQHL